MVYVMSFLALFLFAEKLVARTPTCHPGKHPSADELFIRDLIFGQIQNYT